MRRNWFKMAIFQLFFICAAVTQICDSNSHQTEVEDAISQTVKQYVADQIQAVKSQVDAVLIF